MKKNILITIGVIVVLLIVGFVIYWESSHGNRQLLDTNYRFNRAVIGLPNGEVVEGKVASWLDYDDSDAVQVTIEGKGTYLTHYTNVVLIHD